MVFVCRRHIWTVAALLLFCDNVPAAKGNAVATVTSPPSTVNTAPATCEFRTINYITASLPQQCLRSAWSSTNTSSTKTDRAEDAVATGSSSSEAVTTSSGTLDQDPIAKTDGRSDTQRDERSASGDPTSSTPIPVPRSTETSQPSTVDPESGELNEAAFLSFEEWKKQTLEKAGQANENIGSRKASGPGQKRDPEGTQNNFDSLGDEGEIELDFGAFRNGGGDEDNAQATQMSEPEKQQDSQAQDGPKKQKDMYRSKDAGKTYKERFSYASFDGGATVLKTHSGAKNAKAVLVENKDSYMLSECATENKFLIIELSEDIWIDTLVLANYEFFSSMIRTFRVSVSDRYPVKMEKWKDLGTYEARNSREIQAFLVENPQIWARYIRIEFLSHYGNEYYCPLSLVRVHGTRMLESWKESEAIGNEDPEDNDDQEIEEHFIPDAVAVVVQEEEKLIAELKEAQAALQNFTHDSARNTSEQVESTLDSPSVTDLDAYANSSLYEMMDPWTKPDSLLDILDQIYSSNQASIICQPAEAPATSADAQVMSTPDKSERSITEHQGSTTSPALATTNTISPPSGPVTQNVTESMASETSTDGETVPVSTETVGAASSGPEISSSMPSSATSRPQETVSGQKNRTTTTSSAPSSLPTIQESFFNAVSRRLQLLEANSTLSLKYIEEQSRILREAFTKVEKKQLQKTDAFLESLNSTVLEQLRGFRQQYDEIWQSTVISLESQRDESKREILAVSTRLNILADEVIFQKRMSIVQSILLLLCLGLVIFSRVSGGGALDFQGMQARARNSIFQTSPAYSPPESPSLRRPTSMGMDGQGQWLDSHDGERAADGYTISRLRSRDDSPPTPVSSYSRSDNALTPPSGGDDPLATSASNRISSSSDYADLSRQPTAASPQTNIWLERGDGLERTYLSPSSAGTHRRREGFTNRRSSRHSSELHDDMARDSQSSLESRAWIRQEIHSENMSAHLPSPPPEAGNESQVYISRKPLPELPPHDD